MTRTPIAVWNEVRITNEGISISLISETKEEGAAVEDETWFTFDEMEEMAPSKPISLNLTDETSEALVEAHNRSELGEFIDDRPQSEICASPSLPDVGDVLYDENSPDWSDDDRVRVVSVHPHKRADEHVIQESDFGREKTVADANPSYPDDDPVIIGTYVDGNGTEYAFPASRLSGIGS